VFILCLSGIFIAGLQSNESSVETVGEEEVERLRDSSRQQQQQQQKEKEEPAETRQQFYQQQQQQETSTFK